jgi:hypothetical protein
MLLLEFLTILNGTEPLQGIGKVGKDSWGLSFYYPEWECRCVRFKDTIVQQPLKSSFSNQTYPCWKQRSGKGHPELLITIVQQEICTIF